VLLFQDKRRGSVKLNSVYCNVHTLKIVIKRNTSFTLPKHIVTL